MSRSIRLLPENFGRVLKLWVQGETTINYGSFTTATHKFGSRPYISGA